ncbi:MAG: hypothetical protein BWK78_04640 [Thiotrichaceae bacterium IS1]|nr:MAG: hypothetical protein BWK78_04640 [Thiotrichaceae bacterium IS1]
MVCFDDSRLNFLMSSIHQKKFHARPHAPKFTHLNLANTPPNPDTQTIQTSENPYHHYLKLTQVHSPTPSGACVCVPVTQLPEAGVG